MPYCNSTFADVYRQHMTWRWAFRWVHINLTGAVAKLSWRCPSAARTTLQQHPLGDIEVYRDPDNFIAMHVDDYFPTVMALGQGTAPAPGDDPAFIICNTTVSSTRQESENQGEV